MQITFKREKDDSYRVLVNGTDIGWVAKGWHRVGGQGWVNKFQNRSFPTRRAAAQSLVWHEPINVNI